MTNDGHVGFGMPGFGSGPDATMVLEMTAGEYVEFDAILMAGASAWIVRGDTTRASLTLLSGL